MRSLLCPHADCGEEVLLEEPEQRRMSDSICLTWLNSTPTLRNVESFLLPSWQFPRIGQGHRICRGYQIKNWGKHEETVSIKFTTSLCVGSILSESPSSLRNPIVSSLVDGCDADLALSMILSMDNFQCSSFGVRRICLWWPIHCIVKRIEPAQYPLHWCTSNPAGGPKHPALLACKLTSFAFVRTSHLAQHEKS